METLNTDMNVQSILLILQTHTTLNREANRVRYCGADKMEVTRRCVKSLIASINYAQSRLPDVEFRLQVFDDHSENIVELCELIGVVNVPYTITSLDTHGIMPSILRCYEYGKDHGKQLVYFIQDDYLYFETAIWEMLVDYNAFSTMIGVDEISMFPWDDPYRYLPHNTVETSHIVHGVKRHYRTNYHPSCCFLTHINIIRSNWDLFHDMGTSPITKYMEMDTIGRLFTERGYWLFSPIPSQALHLQFETEKDPYIDWQALWDTYV